MRIRALLTVLSVAQLTGALLVLPQWSSLQLQSYISAFKQQWATPQNVPLEPFVPLSFKLDSIRHHSTQPGYVGISAAHHLTESGTLSIGNVQIERRKVRRMRKPARYLEHRRQLLDHAKQRTFRFWDPATASSSDDIVSSLQSLHSTLDWEDVDLLVPDVTDRLTLLAMARMSSSAYDTPPDPPSWEPGFEGWNLTESFGWVENGVRGHIFTSDARNSTIVVALKGTSAGILPGGDDTGRRDKLNDNLLFSCCCARVSWAWSPVCPCPFSASTCSQPCLERSLLTDSVYYPLITDLYNNVSYHYPGSQIWVTGHSLGGALASLIGLTFGVPSVTFEAPAERMAAKRLHLPLPPRLPQDKSDDAVPRLPITHVFHSADPIPMGTCTGPTSLCGEAGYAMESRCHAGDIILYNTTGLLGWRENIATHRIATMVDDLLTQHWGERVRKANRQRFVSSFAGLYNSFVPLQMASWWPWRGGHGEAGDQDDSWLDKIGSVPDVSDQSSCQDCASWDFVDRDKML